MKKLFYAIGILMLLTSCQEEDAEGRKQSWQEKVNMNFSFRAVGLSRPEYGDACTRVMDNKGVEVTLGGQPGTRAVETLPIESVMKDLMVIQFDGTGEDAALIGTPQYFPQYDAEPAIMSFIASGSDDHTVYFIANGGQDLGPEVIGKTLGDFKKMVYELPAEIKLIEGQGLLMIGSWTGVISGDADVKEVLLSRAMAKVSLHLTNELPSDGNYIQSVSLENVPTVVGYVGLSDPASVELISYPTKTYDKETEYTWYVPENLNTTKEKSTCIVITVGVVGSAMVYPCRIYFNQTEETPDYTLKRNTSYDISVKLIGTTTTEGEWLIDCHYMKINLRVSAGAKITSDANWIDVSNNSDWTEGLSQEVSSSTGTIVYLHPADNLTDASRTAHVTVVDGLNTTVVPIKQNPIQKVGWFGAPDTDNQFTSMLGMEGIEENSYMKWYNLEGAASVDEEYKKRFFDSQVLTEKYGKNSNFEIFVDCYQKNRDKTKIEWYVPSQAQAMGIYVGQQIHGLRTTGSAARGHYWTATIWQNGPIYYGFSSGGMIHGQGGPNRGRFVRCVKNIN